MVPGAVFPEAEASDEQGGRPGQEEANAVGAVFYVVLPDVEDARDEEEDCEGDGGAFDGGIDPKRVWGCGVVVLGAS